MGARKLDDELPTVRDREAHWQGKTIIVAPGSSVVSAPIALPVNTRFAFGDELGRGGMGRVVAARDTLLDRQVAVKQALVDNVAGLRRFEREAKITAKLEHPSIVPIHDVGNDDLGRPYYVMRRIAGDPLSDLVARARSPKARLAFVPNVLAAVDAAAFAHARGILHRDIKPSNILVGAYGETLLIDWGLAREIDDPEADAEDRGHAVGTPGYMAPEQARAAQLDTRADVYALGATLLHVLIGKQIISGAETTWLERVAAGEPVPLGAIDRDVPAELVAIVAKAMAPDPNQRYRDGSEMAADLRAFLAGQLVAAHVYTAWQRVTRFVRRHRVSFSATVFAMIAVIAIGILAIRSVVRERNEANAARDVANVARDVADDRAELMLVEHASALAQREPTRAIALLRQMPPTSRYLRRARDVASVAAAHGITHGKNAHAGLIITLAFAPDQHHLLSGGADGELQIHDVVTGTSRTLLRDLTLRVAVWTDRGRTITYATDDGLFVVDVASGAVHPLAERVDVYQLWTRADDHLVRYVDPTTRSVIECSTDADAKPTVIATNVTNAIGVDDRLLVSGGDTIRMIDARGTRVLARRPDAERRFSILSFSDDGMYAAASGLEKSRVSTTEWNLATGEELYLPGRGLQHFYVDSALFTQDSVHGWIDKVLRVQPEGSRRGLDGDWSTMWRTRAYHGTAAVNHRGKLVILDRYSTYEFPSHIARARMIAGRPDSPYLAIGSETGTILWWDLRMMLPRHIAVGTAAVPCHVDANWIYILELAKGGTVAYPRGAGVEHLVDSHVGICFGGLAGSSRFLIGTEDYVFHLVDGASRRSVRIDGRAVTLTLNGGAFFVRGKIVYEVEPNGTQRPWWIAPGEIAGMSTWSFNLFVALADGRVAWFDTRTRMMSMLVLPKAANMLVGNADALWLAHGPELYRAVRGSSRLVARLDRNIQWIGVMLDDIAIVATDDSALWAVTPDGTVERRSMTLTANVTLGGSRLGAAVNDESSVSRLYLDTGERLDLVTYDATTALVDDRSLIVLRQTPRMFVDIYDDTVPQDPTKLYAWIDSATNAVLRPGSDDTRWR